MRGGQHFDPHSYHNFHDGGPTNTSVPPGRSGGLEVDHNRGRYRLAPR